MPFEHRHHARCGCAGAGFAEHALAGRPFAFPSTVRHFERDRPFAIDHLALEIALDVADRSIRATATLDVRRIDPSVEELPLDAVGFDVRDVAVDGRSAIWQYDGRVLRIPWDAGRGRASVVVTYRADAEARSLLHRARRTLSGSAAPSVVAVPGGGRTALDPLPR
jgi:aminopeptidase N